MVRWRLQPEDELELMPGCLIALLCSVNEVRLDYIYRYQRQASEGESILTQEEADAVTLLKSSEEERAALQARLKGEEAAKAALQARLQAEEEANGPLQARLQCEITANVALQAQLTGEVVANAALQAQLASQASSPSTKQYTRGIEARTQNKPPKGSSGGGPLEVVDLLSSDDDEPPAYCEPPSKRLKQTARKSTGGRCPIGPLIAAHASFT